MVLIHLNSRGKKNSKELAKRLLHDRIIGFYATEMVIILTLLLVYLCYYSLTFQMFRICEICGSIACNVVGANESDLTEQWNEANDVHNAVGPPVPSAESRNFWQGHRFLNFLLACMVFAFVISWLFHFNVPSWWSNWGLWANSVYIALQLPTARVRGKKHLSSVVYTLVVELNQILHLVCFYVYYFVPSNLSSVCIWIQFAYCSSGLPSFFYLACFPE